MAGLFLQVMEFLARLNGLDGLAMLLDDAEHGLDVILGQRLGDVRAAGIAVALEGPGGGGDSALIARRPGPS